MCGRYVLVNSTKEIEYILQQIEGKTDIPYQTNEIFPTNTVPILLSVEDKIKIGLANWGFLNPWNTGVTINARSETINQKPMFKNAIKNGRCVIPASGFFEWKTTESHQKQKFYFTTDKASTMYLAGVYQIVNNQRYFVILTKEANDSVHPFHHRMPVILAPTEVSKWLGDTNDITMLIQGASPDLHHDLVE